MKPWCLVGLASPANGRWIAVQDSDGTVRELNDVPMGMTLIELFEQWESHADRLKAFDPEAASVIMNASISAPLRYPTNLICVGANYKRHLQEFGITPRSMPPFMFLKPPTSTIIGDGDDIVIRTVADRVDWEAEIAVVIGRKGRDIPVEQALDFVAAYTLVNDVSARGVFHNQDAIHPAFAFDWLAAKGQDTFCPMGPGVLPQWFVKDPTAISFELRVNGQLKQSGVTSDMILDIAGCVAAVSRVMTLNPGDVIATGTPQGVGAASGDFLKNGDEVVLTCPLIGKLRNKVRVLQ